MVALTYVGLQPYYARFVFVDRSPWSRFFSEFPDRKTPGYVDLVRDAADVIPSGATVAVVYPTLEWHGGYSYAYFRAQYFLPGRQVVPLGWPSGPQMARLDDAEWAIVFGARTLDDGWTVVAESDAGRIVRRSR